MSANPPETVTHYAPAGDPDPANPGGPAWVVTLAAPRPGALTVTVTATRQIWTLSDPAGPFPFTEYSDAGRIPASRLVAAGLSPRDVQALHRAARLTQAEARDAR